MRCSTATMDRCLKALVIASTLTALAVGSDALAQEDAIPDSVATDVAGGKTEAASEATFSEAPDVKDTPPEETEEEDDRAEVDWSLSFGGSINTGNTRSWNLAAGTDLLLLKGDHRLTIDSLFTLGRADTAPLDPAIGYATIAKKWLFGSRYEYYFTDMDAVWGALGMRWDPLAGFDLQMLANAGYLRAFVKEENHFFAGRIGYSYTYEKYVNDPPTFLGGNSNIHGLLLALDYENKLNEHVELLSSITYIGNLNKLPLQRDAKAFQDNRIYWSLALLSQLAERLAFEARFLLLYDSRPVPEELAKVDTTTIFSLVVTLL